jgi:hypothetical protein
MHEPLFSWLARERLAELRREAEVERRATAARGPRPHPAAHFLIRVGRSLERLGERLGGLEVSNGSLRGANGSLGGAR